MAQATSATKIFAIKKEDCNRCLNPQYHIKQLSKLQSSHFSSKSLQRNKKLYLLKAIETIKYTLRFQLKKQENKSLEKRDMAIEQSKNKLNKLK